MNENLNTQEIKTIDIYPCKNSRRILTFLADFFMCFIAAIFLFEILVKPISFASIKYNEGMAEVNTAMLNNLNILYGNELLYKTDVTNGNLTDSIKVTCDEFTKEFCFETEVKTHNVFERYLTEFKHENLMSLYDKFEKEADKYFVVNKEEKSIVLRTEYVDYFKPKFEDKNEMSEVGSKKYDQFQEEFFLKFYAEIILQDVAKNDLTLASKPELGSYKSNFEIHDKFDKKVETTIKISASITFLLTMIIFYFIVPLTNHKGRTCSEMIMKIERVDIQSIKYLKKRFIVTEGIMNTLSNSVMLFLIPFVSYGIGPVFGLTELISISAIGLLFVIIQFFLLMFTKMNQTFKELSTHSICVDTSTMDEYYKEKGYDF